MVFIYILLLETKKFYIGKTNNPHIRLDSHFNSNGSEWTKIYKPIKVYELISDCDSYDEDKYTLKYMEKMGINNVRGGSFCQVELSEEQLKLIKNMIKGATDKCFKCGDSSHFIKDCNESKIQDYLKNINNENIQNETIKINSIYEKIIELKKLVKFTNFISIDDLPEIKKESKDIKRLNYLLEQNKERQFTRSERGELTNLYKNNYWKNNIYRTYHEINNNSKPSNKDIIILGLELIKFNLEMKKELKKIFDKYHNEEFVKNLLSRLYEKEIKIIKSQISL